MISSTRWAKARKDEVNALAEKLDLNQRDAAAEYVAQLAEQGATLKGRAKLVLARAIKIIRDFLRKIGLKLKLKLKLKLSDQDILGVIAKARNAIENKADASTQHQAGNHAPAYSREDNAHLADPKAEARFTEMRKLAHEAKPGYDETLNRITEDYPDVGAEALTADVKGRPRSVEKINEDYKGVPERIKDLVRGTIKVNRPEDVSRLFTALSDYFELTGKQRNLWADGSPTYADAMTNVKLPNGTVAEVQVNVPAMLVAKRVCGHFPTETQVRKERNQPAGDCKSVDR